MLFFCANSFNILKDHSFIYRVKLASWTSSPRGKLWPFKTSGTTSPTTQHYIHPTALNIWKHQYENPKWHVECSCTLNLLDCCLYHHTTHHNNDTTLCTSSVGHFVLCLTHTLTMPTTMHAKFTEVSSCSLPFSALCVQWSAAITIQIAIW
jgi:hypothetical protein